MYKKISKFLLMALIFGCFCFIISACSKKTGCKMNEDMGPKMDKKGNLSTKRGKTKLFKN